MSAVIGTKMSRRYLTLSEAKSALDRGNTIECFLGTCVRNGERGIKWLSLSSRGEKVGLAIYETADLGNESHLDLYEFGPLDPNLELDEPDQEKLFSDFESAISEVDQTYPASSTKLMNEGVIQDEYSDFMSRGRK